MRVAAIDQGTNTTRLLVADVEDGNLSEVVRRSTITRLGEGVDERRRLLPLPIARVRNSLTDYRREAERLGAERTLLVATSAVRDAENGEAFLGEIEWSYGFTTKLATGDEEAALMLRGVGEIGPRTLVLDVGGGSTELVTTDFRTSLDIGSVRLTERYLHSDPPVGYELDACAARVRGALPALDVSDGVGVAGTVTSLAALDLGLAVYDRERVDGHRLSLEGVERQLQRLAALPLARAARGAGARARARAGDRRRRRDRPRGHGGVRHRRLRVSERDILDGIAYEAATLPEPVEGDAPPGAYTCC